MVMPLLISGDAAFAGQGVIAECFGLSGLRGHRTGGSVHFIVNNQIGFTTYPRFSRSSPYPSDVAKMIEAPIFHANGDDPEAVVYAAKVATEFRQKFQKPVVIDMFCYRRFGHNEGDEPAFTQPLMYKAIRAHPSTLEIYGKRLVGEGVVTEGEVEKMRADWRARLDAELEASQSYKANSADWLDGRWAGMKAARDRRRSAPRQDRRRGRDAQGHRQKDHRGAGGLSRPSHHPALPRCARQGDRDRRGHRLGDGRGARVLLAAARRPSGAAVRPGQRARHVLAAPFGAGRPGERGPPHPVQSSRATSRRATRSSTRCSRRRPCSASNTAIRSPSPNALTLWEAQFGDFANGAQVLFDQFISSGERKWLRMSGLVCLLPHGYEGQGPEHSSARLERFLQMCAEDNMQVANCSTPANYFHILRRQLQARDQEAADPDDAEIAAAPQARGVAARRDGTGTSFHRVLWDDAQLLPGEKIKLVADDKIRRVVLCSGKVYYDLYEEREKRGIDDIYLLRVEQLYPFPTKALVHRARRASSRPKWSGARRSRATWAPGTSSSTTSNGCSTRSRPSSAARAMPPARRRRRRRSDRCRSTWRS